LILAIYGAGGLGKEIYDTAISKSSEKYEMIVFIDDNEKIHDFYSSTVYTFERFQDSFNVHECRVIIGVGEPSTRSLLYEKIMNSGYCIASVIHSSAIISPTSKVGNGTYIGPLSFISSDTSVGHNVIIQPHAMIGHDVSIGDSSVISTNVVLAGNCMVGARTFVALNVSVEQKIKIGDDSIIGMASCVNKDIPSEVIAMGYPARVLKKNELRRVF
jgi:sugar O-acyltransferase (sialic acid O-acetyltransferase NeuD family)